MDLPYQVLDDKLHLVIIRLQGQAMIYMSGVGRLLSYEVIPGKVMVAGVL